MRSAFPSRSNSGFTLIEVMIAMAILAFISFGSYLATIETYKLRDSLSTEGDFYNSIRLSVGIIQRDVSLIYSPISSVDLSAKDPNNPNPTPPPNLSGDAMQTFPFWSPVILPSGLRPSRFVGSTDKMSFISLSHHRIYKDSPESEFAKISYELRSDSNKDYSGAQMLIRTESPNAFAREENKDPMSRTDDILHGIKKWTYSYSQRDGNTWKTFRDWDSDREETKNIFPDMIEVKIEVVGPNKQKFEGNYKFRPEIPINGYKRSI